MTDPDPAVTVVAEALRTHIYDIHGDHQCECGYVLDDDYPDMVPHVAEVVAAAVREAGLAAPVEALKALRRLHTPGPISQLSTAWMVGGTAECTTCRRDWPCSSARLIYTPDELSGAVVDEGEEQP